jgi:hypothetical protein
MKALHMIAFCLVIIGGLNWGLVALGNYMGGSWNAVDALLGAGSALGNLVYAIVGISALYLGFTHKGECKCCSAGSM